MNITEEMVNITNDLTADICHRIDLLKHLLSEYGEDNYLTNLALGLMTPGHIQYDLNDEQFYYDFYSTAGFCSYLMERQKARENAIYTDTDSFKYPEPAESEAKNESI